MQATVAFHVEGKFVIGPEFAKRSASTANQIELHVRSRGSNQALADSGAGCNATVSRADMAPVGTSVQQATDFALMLSPLA